MQSDDDDLSRPIQPVDSSLDVKIERPSRETWVAAADVLCGRGKTSFNHGEFTFTCVSGRHNFKSEKCVYVLTVLLRFLSSREQEIPRRSFFRIE